MDSSNDFKAALSITNMSLTAQAMQEDLPSNYTRNKTSNVYAFLYGAGASMEVAKQTLGQLEANAALYAPQKQSGVININGSGKYIVSFDIPYVVPPTSADIQASSFTDAYIEFTDRFGMTITVTTDANDAVNWTTNGYVGAATNKYLGDGLFNNFGSVLQFPRLGDSQIDETYVKRYESFSLLILVDSITPVANNPVPPKNALRGFFKPTSVISDPAVSYELVDATSRPIALLSFSNSIQDIVSFINQEVYIVGHETSFRFDRWQQPSYVQEVFRADNKYRRILSGLNQSLIDGPSVGGISNLIETLFSQPYIPHDYWEQSDYRIYKRPKYLQYISDPVSGAIKRVSSTSQIEGYASVPPIVEVQRITADWRPEVLTYNTRPEVQPIADLDKVQVTNLNTTTQFDISNELIRQLRVGLDVQEGGLINWNFASLPASGFTYYENDVNHRNVFLSSNANSFANIKLFYYRQQADGYHSTTPLVFNRDYTVVATTNFYVGNNSYSLPSELIQNYQVASTIPYLGTGQYYDGRNDKTKPPIPAFAIQLDLSFYNPNQVNHFPLSPNDFIVYSFAEIRSNQTYIEGLIESDPFDSTLPEYCDVNKNRVIQPSDSPFLSSAPAGNYVTNSSASGDVAAAQNSFVRFQSNSGYHYINTMIDGQITFTKTINVSNLLPNAPYIENLSHPGIALFESYGTTRPIYANVYAMTGQVVRNLTASETPILTVANAPYLLVDPEGNPIAIFTDTSVNVSSHLNTGITTFYGSVQKIYWDTRIANRQFRGNGPIFQASANFDGEVIPFVPEIDPKVPLGNSNYMVELPNIPLGGQQTITASWTFDIAEITRATNPRGLGFGDEGFPGIMTIFTGRNWLRSEGFDPDDATYTQAYTSPMVDAYFLNYKDYVNTPYGGGKLTSNGNVNNYLYDTLYDSRTIPAGYGTVLNFFSPVYGFFSLSILPNMTFEFVNTGTPVSIVRPNNKGLSLRVDGDSYAGLAFYGKRTTKIIDKPTRFLIDYTFAGSNQQRRKKILEIQEGEYAGYVDALKPNEVLESSVFYISGNQYKYSHMGMDQAANTNGNNTYSLAATPPIFSYDPQVLTGVPQGKPLRYRRAMDGDPSYYNRGPEKIAFFRFDLDSLPIDTIVNEAILELYFASGFSIRQAKDMDFELNYNSSWNRSRLSGNGSSEFKNVHWRKNYFEILLPYAFLAEETAVSYGINNLFQVQQTTGVPAPQFPQSNLEYLGYIALDEIDSSRSDGTTVGLSNIILTPDSIVEQVIGPVIIHQTTLNGYSIEDLDGSSRKRIQQREILPNMKVIVYPYGFNTANPLFIYGYVKSVLPSTYVGLEPSDIGIYKQLLDYVIPLYSQYTFKLLEADTYFPYMSFGRESTISDTVQDISF